VKWKGWERVRIPVPDTSVGTGEREAVAPLIVSASRATDIPAFYGDWFMDRLSKGYAKWKSPFGGEPVYVSFSRARLFVFWSKNPAPFLRHLDEISRRGYGSYFLYTLNDYGDEGLEPNVPPLEERITTFLRLSQRIGKGRVIWRFDPLVLSDRIPVPDLLEKIRAIGDTVHRLTERLVISFVEIERYPKVRRNLDLRGFSGVREFSDAEVLEFSEGLMRMNEEWGLSITGCAERQDLSRFGIGRGQCISYPLIRKEFGSDPVLAAFLGTDPEQPLVPGNGELSAARWLKDPGQRSRCGCIVSKDIGQYNTCMHHCVYCYANKSPASAGRNFAKYRDESERGLFHESIVE
jgi:hypothetical protein